jgi:hypothetical protein
VGYRQDALDEQGVFGAAQRGVGEQGMDRGQAGDLDAVIATLRAEIAVADAIEAWAETEARLSPGPLRRRLAQLKDIATAVTAIRRLLAARDAIEDVLRRQRVRYDVGSAELWDLTQRVVGEVPRLRQARIEARRLAEFEEQIGSWAHRYRSAPELADLLTALRDRDVDMYRTLWDTLEQAREDQRAGRSLLDTSQRLAKAHPMLADDLRTDPQAKCWDLQLGDFGRAWAWGYAHQWYEAQHDIDAEKVYERSLDEAEQVLQITTRELAGCLALLQCVTRTTPEQGRALQEYRSAIASVGRGASEHKAAIAGPPVRRWTRLVMRCLPGSCRWQRSPITSRPDQVCSMS